ncbi:uncharacterized protein LOC62_01G001617 [Vanrija pseudolonga]|uniref:Uncharacterized protein n=1 Tax=Vanrija pseudolonga TaxID=143232 RepID=A0AAF0Y4F5_9TREE|nr:hypothetical protein LOC62_01G001617 [Vanrija pseudolonga]
MVSAATIIGNSPHLVDAIMAHATRATLVTCLRVSRDVHNSAGAALYHTIRIHGRILDDLLEGANLEKGLYTNPPGEAQAPLTVLKNRLLARIRVLSIGEHEWELCEHEVDPHMLDKFKFFIWLLFRHVQVVRIVLPPRGSGLGSLCQRSAHKCGFLPLLSPRKLVIRNVSIPAFCEISNYWYHVNLPEVTWILPPERRGDAEASVDPSYYIGSTVAASPSAKMIFHDEWESWTALPMASGPIPRRPLGPYAPTDVTEFCHYTWSHGHWPTAKEYDTVVYGLETVHFSATQNDRVLRHFKNRFPSQPLTPGGLCQVVKDQIMGLPGSECHHSSRIMNHAYVFKTLADYAALDPADTRFELDDEYRS